MNENQFKNEMRRAEAARRAERDPQRESYWAGYIRGLRRNYHGAKFGTEAEHRKWMSLADENTDESRRQRGLGYLAGLEFAGEGDQWQSAGLHEHPAKHRRGTMGHVCLSGVGVYYLRVGASHMSCPQGWAAAIHAAETREERGLSVEALARSLGVSERTLRRWEAGEAQPSQLAQEQIKKLLEEA